MPVLLPGSFKTFDISHTSPVIISAGHTNVIIHNYMTAITHDIPIVGINIIKMYPSGSSLFTASTCSGLNIYDVSRATPIYTYNEVLTDYTFTDERLILGTSSNLIRLYDLRMRSCVRVLKFTGQKIRCFGKYFMAIDYDKFVIGTWKELCIDKTKNYNIIDGLMNLDGYFYIVRNKDKLYLRRNEDEYEKEVVGGSSIYNVMDNKFAIPEKGFINVSNRMYECEGRVLGIISRGSNMFIHKEECVDLIKL